MSDITLSLTTTRKQKIDLSKDERFLLTTIIDLLIPSDDDFPPPSSLELIDEFLHYLIPNRANKGMVSLTEQRLHAVLQELNQAAGGAFCNANSTLQRTILQQLEWQEPALFQTLWALANHSYYTRLAKMPRIASN